MQSFDMAAEGSVPRGDEERRKPWFLFRCSDQRLAIPALRVEEVTEASGLITRLPQLPGHIPGVVVHQGMAVPVLDTGCFLGLSSINTDSANTDTLDTQPSDLDKAEHPPRMLVTRLRDMTVVLLVDQVAGLRVLLDDDLEPSLSLPSKIRTYCPHQARLGDDLIGLLDLDALLSAAKPRKPS